MPDADPLSVTFRFQQSIRLRDAQARLDELRNRIDTALAGQPMPAFAVVLIGPMLWTRFESTAGSVNMVSHATGPVGDDVVIVTDEAVVAALAEGRITAREARAQGLVKAYGTSENVDRVSALLDRSFELKENPTSLTPTVHGGPISCVPTHCVDRSSAALLAAALLVPGFAAVAAETSGVGIANTADKAKLEKSFPKQPGYSPYAGRNFPTLPLFGDTHLHTSFSMDAGAFGARLTPKDAYRFARGEEVTSNSGQPVKLSRPLDFLVVADHSDGMGFFPQLMSGDPELLATPQGRKWYDQIKGGQGADAAIDIITSFGKGQMPKGFPTAGHLGLSQCLERDHQGRRGLQRTRPLHRLHRLRVDLEHRRQQPAPQRRLPRQRRAGQPRRALHHPAAAGQRQPGRPVEVDGGHRAEDRQPKCWPSRTTAT